MLCLFRNAAANYFYFDSRNYAKNAFMQKHLSSISFLRGVLGCMNGKKKLCCCTS